MQHKHSTRLVSDGKVFLTFVREWLAMVFQADSDGYVGGDWQQWRLNACTRVTLANMEMNKLPSHVRARRSLDHGCPRYDEEVWQFSEPSTERAKEFNPKWSKVDQELSEADAHYLDEWQKKHGRR